MKKLSNKPKSGFIEPSKDTKIVSKDTNLTMLQQQIIGRMLRNKKKVIVIKLGTSTGKTAKFK